MPAFSFDGPGQPGASFVTTEEAHRWLCVSESTFLRMVGKKAGAPIPGVPEWMRSMDHAGKQMWAVEDVIVLRHILVRRRLAGHAPPPEDDEDEKR